MHCMHYLNVISQKQNKKRQSEQKKKKTKCIVIILGIIMKNSAAIIHTLRVVIYLKEFGTIRFQTVERYYV